MTTKGATVITKPPSVMDVQSKSTREPPNSDRRRQECIKDILVPTYNPRVYPRIWRREEIDRIKSASRVVTKQERQQQIEQNELNRERLERESEQRKKMLQAIDKQRQAIAPATPKLPHSDDEEEDPVQVLDRAYLAQQERTQEVMRVNRMILATKCQVVREAQIAEKQEITRSLRDEELQVEKNILNDCDVAIKEEQAQREEKKKINEKFADELREQLKRRDLIKFLEAQRIEEEANANAIAKESLTEDLQRQTQEKKERIAKLREDLKITCELSELQRHMTFEEQRVAEMKAQEYMRKLAERDTELKKEKRLIQEQKQREADRLLVRQTKFLESKSEKEEMKLRLLREEKDREYRKREKEAAVRRKRMEQQLFTDRGAQVDEMKRQREQQTVEEEQLHKQTVAKLREEEEKTRAEAERLKGLKLKYRHGMMISSFSFDGSQTYCRYRVFILSFSEILKQINEKSTVTKEKKQQMMNELHLDKQKEEIRKKALELVIDHKINAMRQANIPENMVRDVERQIKAEETIKFRANVK